MAKEIERRYLPKAPDWRPEGQSNRIIQGYFWLNEMVAAHIAHDGQQAYTLVMEMRGQTTSWSLPLPKHDGHELHQATNGEEMGSQWTLRVRQSDRKGGEFCIKGKSMGIARPEYEYPLPADITQTLLQLCAGTHIIKRRFEIPHEGFVWEVDVYDAPLPDEPAVMIEVELPDETTQAPLPPWVGEEVSHIKTYANAALARRRWLAVKAGGTHAA